MISVNQLNKGVLTKVVSATFSHSSPCTCPCYGLIQAEIIKHGFKSSLIKMPTICEFVSYLLLNKQRFKCLECNKTFTASNTVVHNNCKISNDTRLLILNKAKIKMSEKDIARQCNVSQAYVNKLLFKAYSSRSINKNYLPKHLSFDEFKSCKDSTYAMSFIMIDSTNSKIIDIVQDRKLSSLISYFKTYSDEASILVSQHIA